MAPPVVESKAPKNGRPGAIGSEEGIATMAIATLIERQFLERL